MINNISENFNWHTYKYFNQNISKLSDTQVAKYIGIDDSNQNIMSLFSAV